ncbi:MAG: MFS transporter [Limisphaerales bacterium]
MSYPLGILADRVSRKQLLGWGLFINALGFIGLALSPNYLAVLASVVVAAIGGSCFHPAATAMVARLYPEATGKALGLIGIGAGAGFFVGPIYAGWRATQSGDWRTPVLEFGVAGIACAAAFAWLADNESAGDLQSPSAAPGTLAGDCNSPAQITPPVALFPTAALWLLFFAAAVAFALRDFAGHSMGSLGSLFLQKAHGFSVKEA